MTITARSTLDTTAPASRGAARPGIRGFLILAYTFLLPVQIGTGADLRLAVSDLFVVLYLLASSFRLRRLTPAWSSWVSALLAVTGTGLLVAFVRTGEVSRYALLQKGLGLVVLVVTMACILDYARSAERVRQLLVAFLWGVVLNVVVGLAALVVQAGDPSALSFVNLGGVRLAGLAIDPNAFGGLIACALMAHLLTARSAAALVGPRLRIVITAVLTIGLVLTFSRSAWLGTVTGVLAALAVSRRAARSFAPVLAIGVAAVPLLGALLLPNLAELAARPEQIDSRTKIISDAVTDLGASPLVGTGLGTYAERHGVIIHNTALWMLTEYGVLGLLVVTGLVVSTFARLLRCVREGPQPHRTLALALLAMHAVMLGLSMGIEALYQRSWWLVLALAGTLSAAVREPDP